MMLTKSEQASLTYQRALRTKQYARLIIYCPGLDMISYWTANRAKIIFNTVCGKQQYSYWFECSHKFRRFAKQSYEKNRRQFGHLS